jgi:predicted anti-sigma-YlaC factor YlaD
MQCSKWDELMSLRLDGLLDSDQQQQLQAHLADCQTCRDQWAVVSWLSLRLKAEPPAAPASDFAARVTARLEQRETRRRRLYSTVGLCIGSVGLWAAAALAVLLLFAVLVDPSLQTVLMDVGLSLVRSALALLSVLGQALWVVGDALVTRPTGLLLIGYALLAVALAAFWTRVVFRRWGYVPQ